MGHHNLIGPQVRLLRTQRRWTQRCLAEKLQTAGLNTSRSGLAKIEARMIGVTDYELFYFACVFQVSLYELFPPIDPSDPNLHDTLIQHLKNHT